MTGILRDGDEVERILHRGKLWMIRSGEGISGEESAGCLKKAYTQGQVRQVS